jgi:hypothetical protein
MTMEESREELLARADQLDADADAHAAQGREERADQCRDEAERLRQLAEGAPVGPSPDTIEGLKQSVFAKLDEAKAHLESAASIYEGLRGLVDQVLDTGMDALAGNSALADAEALRAENEQLRTQLADADTALAERDLRIAKLEAGQADTPDEAAKEGPADGDSAPEGPTEAGDAPDSDTEPEAGADPDADPDA